MKYTVIILALCFCACGDGEILPFNHSDAKHIEGMWKCQNGVYTTFHFSDGLMTASTFLPGAILQKQYTYSTAEDTVYLSEYPGGAQGFWTIYFENENTADVYGSDSLGLTVRLERF